jgi:hypothetical protein
MSLLTGLIDSPGNVLQFLVWIFVNISSLDAVNRPPESLHDSSCRFVIVGATQVWPNLHHDWLLPVGPA